MDDAKGKGLLHAAVTGDKAKVLKLLAKGAGVNATWLHQNNSWTPRANIGAKAEY